MAVLWKTGGVPFGRWTVFILLSGFDAALTRRNALSTIKLAKSTWKCSKNLYAIERPNRSQEPYTSSMFIVGRTLYRLALGLGVWPLPSRASPDVLVSYYMSFCVQPAFNELTHLTLAHRTWIANPM